MLFPFVHQHDANDCGPACLAMISAFYGRRQSIADLRERAGTDRHGTNLAGLIRAASEIGFRPRAVRASLEALGQVTLPAIAHWSEGGRSHFVVIFRIRRRRVVLGDPAVGQRRLDLSAFESHWTRTLLLLEPGPDLRSLAATPVATLWSLLGCHRKLFTDALVAGLMTSALAVFSALFVRALIDFVIPSGRGSTLNWLGVGMILVLATRSSMLALRTYLLAHLGQRIDAELVLGYHHHVLGLPLHFFSARRTGEILARVQDAVRIRAALGTTGLSIVVDTVTLIVASTAMLWLDWRLTVLAFAFIPVVAILIAVLTPGLRRTQARALERSAHFQAHTVEAVETIETLRAARAEDRMRLRGEQRFGEVLDVSLRSEIYGLWMSTSATLLTGLSGLSLLWVGAHAALAGRITTGELMALYTLLGTIMGPVERLAGANQVIQDALLASVRVGEILCLAAEERSPDTAGIDRPIEGGIGFHRVRFRYGTRPVLFDGLTLTIPQGECCRISGASGSGKSTLARLLVRFHEPEDGRVEIDGIDVREYSLDSLRRQVVFVGQDSRVLGISIADNIRLGCPQATPAEVRSAAMRAGVHTFVESSPQGYAALVGERGVSLSGGERQRLVLARAILGDPAILILDEPTNHLDPLSVQAVNNIIEDRRLRRRTTLLISHDPLPADRTVSIHGHQDASH